MPMIVHRPVSRVRPDCNWLFSRRRDVTSQFGQDGILEAIFAVIEPTNKFCVEFGAWDGKNLSNTWRLITEDNWSAILAEANVEKHGQIESNHPYPRVRALNQFITWDGADTFDRTMKRNDAPHQIDLVSIDVDGNDWHIWNAIQDYRPRVVLIEFNPTVSNEVYFVQDANLDCNHGSSLAAMIELGKDKGYSLICADFCDAFFVLDELYPAFSIPDNSIDAMHSSSECQTHLFQGYDGTLFNAGFRGLAWTPNRSFAYDQFQLLPEPRRMAGRPD